jgi:hypothetical protein
MDAIIVFQIFAFFVLVSIIGGIILTNSNRLRLLLFFLMLVMILIISLYTPLGQQLLNIFGGSI